MISLFMATLVLSSFTFSSVEGKDFYNVKNDILTSSYGTAGAPTDYAYLATYDEPTYSYFDNINIIKIPYQLSIDNSRIEDLTLRIDTTRFYMTPLYSPTYEYKYYSLYLPSVPSGSYQQPFRYFTNLNVDRYYLTIPTTHTESMALQYMEEIVFINSFNYTEDLQYYGYQNGFDDGYQDGALDGYQDAYTDGYNDGVIAGDTPQEWQGLFGILRTGFNSIASILQIQVLPGFTLGLLLFLPVIFGVAYAILRLFMRGG